MRRLTLVLYILPLILAAFLPVILKTPILDSIVGLVNKVTRSYHHHHNYHGDDVDRDCSRHCQRLASQLDLDSRSPSFHLRQEQDDCHTNPPCYDIRKTTTIATTTAMSFFQKQLTLPSRSRGSYLITDEIESQLPEIRGYRTGVMHLFIQHTSAALSLNENWDDDVRADMSDALDRIVPEDSNRKGNLYRHSAEGPDDMPAHVKSALIGASVSVPITDGRLNTGTWQGIWMLEFRRAKHARRVVATIYGEKM